MPVGSLCADGSGARSAPRLRPDRTAAAGTGLQLCIQRCSRCAYSSAKGVRTALLYVCAEPL